MSQHSSATVPLRLFITVPPGLEDLALSEIQEKAQLGLLGEGLSDCMEANPAEKAKGGILLLAPGSCLTPLHHYLKIPTKITLKLWSFKARDFPKLYSKLLALPWRDYLASTDISFKVSCKKSRIIHSERVEKTAKRALEKYFQAYPLKKKNTLGGAVQIHLDIYQDVCQVGLNLSGELLYKRNLRTDTGKAPLRENLAAALLYLLHTHAKKREIELANTILLDPMCGSGVFPMEALEFFRPCTSRDFAFTKFLKESWWKIAPSEEMPSDATLFKYCLGIESDPMVFKQLESNLQVCSNDAYKIKHGDFFQTDISDLSKNKSLVTICNLPYGKRIPLKNAVGFYSNFFQHCSSNKDIKLLGALFPKEYEHAPLPKGTTVLERRYFKNGGIDCVLLILY